MNVLRSEIPSGMCAKLRTVAASNNRVHPTRSLSSSPLASTINCSPGSQALLEVTYQDHSTGITLLLLVRAIYMYFCSSRISRLWWIIKSTQHHRRSCNKRTSSSSCRISILFQYLMYILTKLKTFSRSWKPILKFNTFSILSIPYGNPVLGINAFYPTPRKVFYAWIYSNCSPPNFLTRPRTYCKNCSLVYLFVLLSVTYIWSFVFASRLNTKFKLNQSECHWLCQHNSIRLCCCNLFQVTSSFNYIAYALAYFIHFTGLAYFIHWNNLFYTANYSIKFAPKNIDQICAQSELSYHQCAHQVLVR